MKMKTLNLYRVLRTRILLKVFIMTAVALHFGFGGWNELLFYSTAPKHKNSSECANEILQSKIPEGRDGLRMQTRVNIGTTSPFFLGATDDGGKTIMKMNISKHYIYRRLLLWL